MFRSIAAVAALALTSLAAPHLSHATDITQATLNETSPTPDVSTAEMRQTLKDGSAIVLDTRISAEFAAGHIPGAKLVERTSPDRVDTVGKITGSDKAAKLILYCNGPYCQASRALAGELVKAGYKNVKRYQLGLPVWRALGGPVAVEREGIARVYKADQTAIFIDTRPATEFAKGSMDGAMNIQPDALANAKLPEDDFNRRIVLFGADETEARRAADVMSKRPWHNVSYFPGSFDTLRTAFVGK